MEATRDQGEVETEPCRKRDEYKTRETRKIAIIEARTRLQYYEIETKMTRLRDEVETRTRGDGLG